MRRTLFVASAAVFATALAVVGLAASAPLGQVTEFAAGLNAGSSPRSVAPGPDGNVWFNDMGTTKAVGRITQEGTITEFTAGLNSGSAPADLVAGPDGDVWFADRGTTGAIGRITPQGTITEFSTGLPAGSSPRGIAAGADGNIWFGDDGATKAIGRITPAGTISEFTTGLNAGSSPTGVTGGPDGNVWFTDKGTVKAIGMVTPSGAISEFSLPATSAPADITTGPDGNLWFTDQGTPRAIGMIDPTSHTIVEFSSGLGTGSLPNGLATGADGDVWFADRGTTKAIGSIDPSTHAITEYALAATSSPRGVGPGADGNLWFSDPGTPRAIGRFGLGAPAASVSPPTVTGRADAGVPQTCAGAVWSTWAGTQPSADAYGFDGYQWLLDGAPIAGASSASYTPTGVQAGHGLSCRLTVTYTLLGVTVSATSAEVTVEGVPEQLADLAAAVAGVGPGASLGSKVAQIQAAAAAGQTGRACDLLGAFVGEVRAQTGKKLTAAQAASFTAQATNVESLLGC